MQGPANLFHFYQTKECTTTIRAKGSARPNCFLVLLHDSKPTLEFLRLYFKFLNKAISLKDFHLHSLLNLHPEAPRKFTTLQPKFTTVLVLLPFGLALCRLATLPVLASGKMPDHPLVWLSTDLGSRTKLMAGPREVIIAPLG